MTIIRKSVISVFADYCRHEMGVSAPIPPLTNQCFDRYNFSGIFYKNVNFVGTFVIFSSDPKGNEVGWDLLCIIDPKNKT
ncbi:MAG: hypothetical protein WCQ26_00095 [Pseudanabaena sp. ELA748]